MFYKTLLKTKGILSKIKKVFWFLEFIFQLQWAPKQVRNNGLTL